MTSPSGRVPGRASEPSRDGFGIDGGYGTLRGFLLGYLGFLRDGEYMGEEAESEAERGHQTPPQARPEGGPRLAMVWPGARPSGPSLRATSS